MYRLIWVPQRANNECGLCALSTILRYYGVNISINKMKRDLDLKEDGISAKNLINLASNYNLVGVGYYANYNDLLKIKKPFIAYLKTSDGGHYVTIYKIKKNKVFIIDPAVGYIKIKKVNFLATWTGIIITLKNENKNVKTNNYWIKAILFDYKNLTKVFLYTIINLLFSYFIIYSWQLIINKKNFELQLIILILLMIMQSIWEWFYGLKQVQYEQKFDRFYHQNLTNKFLYSSQRKNYLFGDFIARIKEFDYFKAFTTEGLINIIINFITIMMIIVITFFNNKAFCFLLLIVLLTSLYLNFKIKRYKDNKIMIWQKDYSLYNENLFKIFEEGNFSKYIFNKSYSNYLKSSLNIDKNYLLEQFFYNIIGALIIPVFVILNKNNFFANYLLIVMFINAIQNLNININLANHAFWGFERFNDLIEEE